VIRVFVYGSLKPGEKNYNRYCRGRVQAEQEAIVQGNLFDLPHLGYPAMTPGEGWVYGYLLSFGDADLLAALDQLEDYEADRPLAENEYYREWIGVMGGDRQPLGAAWCYFMLPEAVQARGGVQVSSGRWSSRGAAWNCP